MKKQIRFLIGIGLGLAAILCIAAMLLYFGIILLNNPSRAQYPVRGVDVSAYQGEIDWETLAAQNIQFAYIKATEGSGHVDQYFAANWKGAAKTGLRIGAYHFFSFDSAGATQARNFIETVPKMEGMLPPVVDFEFYGDKESNLPERDAARLELSALLDELERHYGMKPMLYVMEKPYRLYIADAYAAYDIWVRNVISAPRLSDGRAWTMWQYTNRARLDGYQGVERYIDMNVYNGNAQDFEDYGREPH